MTTLKLSISRNLSPNLKILSIPILVLVATGFLSLIAFNNFYPRITKKVEEYNSLREVEKTLKDKASHLAEVRGSLSSQGEKLVIIMPDNSPIAWMISQLRLIAFEQNVTITQIDVTGASSQENLSNLKLNFEVEITDAPSLTSFLNAILNIAPISTIDSVEFKLGKTAQKQASIELSLFWSPFPKTLAPLTDPVTRLSQSEVDLLNSVSGARLPSFTTLQPSLPEDREAPFN